MPRNTLAIVDWPVVGLRALAWLRETAPHRQTHIGLVAECAAALSAAGVNRKNLSDWLGTGRVRPEWLAIKATVGRAYSAHAAVPPANGNGSAPAAATRSLVDRLRQRRTDERREAAIAACPVCRLPADLREQIRVARRAEYTVAEVVALLTEDGIEVTSASLYTHSTGGHER